MNWKAVRERDGKTKTSEEIKWIEWDENETFKELHDDIAIGRSLFMSPFTRSYTWMTTKVTKVLYMDETHIRFKTKNSTYDLYKL